MAGSTSGNVSSVDDPARLGAFLARMHGDLKTSATQSRRPTTPPQSQISAVEANGHTSEASSDDLNGPASEHVSDSGHKTPDDGLTSAVTSMAASPDPGRRAPPPTPASQRATAAATSQGTIHLEPVPEDETDVLVTLAENSNQNLLDSKHAFPRPAGVLLHKTRAALSTKNANTANYQESVLSDFRRKTEEVFVAQRTPKQHNAVETLSKDKASATLATDGRVPATPSNPTRSSQKLKDLLAEEVVKNDMVGNDNNAQENAMVTTNIDEVKTPVVVSTPPMSHTEEEQPEDREHLTHFKTWGPAIARSSPRARPRMVILSGLPMNADNTLVASVLHGGAIEAYKLITGSEYDNNKRATALFTEADAAQKYYEKYPNGVEFKYNGRKSVAFVTMGKEVGNLSSVLRGQLEAGASRIVRATGADENWGMRALHKLAEGKSRRIEGIADYWREEIRTIVFRFTNIPDAVQFRGQLMRDEEWDMCNIQFMDDPCAKATGVHME